MRRGRSELAQLLEVIGALHCRGFEIDYEQAGELLELPAYPWQRRRFWPDVAIAPTPSPTAELAANLDVVARFDRDRVPELDAHTVSGRPIVSAGVMLELMLRAAAMLEPNAQIIDLAMLEFQAPIAGDATVQLELATPRLSLRPAGGPACVFGRLELGGRLAAPPPSTTRAGFDLSAAQHYRALLERGVDYAPQLRAIESLARGPRFAQARLRPGPTRAAVLDAALQAVLAAVEQPGSYVTARIDHIRLDAASLPRTREILVELERVEPEVTAQVWLLDEHGQVLGSFAGVGLAALRREPSVLQRRCWRAVPGPRASAPIRSARRVLVGPDDRTSAAVIAALAERGIDVTRVDRISAELEFDHLLITFAPTPADAPCPFQTATETCARMIRAIRACNDARALRGRTAKVWVVSERAQAIVAGESTVLGSSALAAIARVAAIELPDVGVRIIDVGDLDDPRQRRALAAELHDEHGPPWLALRPGGQRCERLVPALEPEPVPSRCWRPKPGTVIVSGGLGGIGRAVVAWLVERGVERVVILGRRTLDADGDAFLRGLGTGTTLRYLAVDVADLAALREALHDELPHTMGVIHSAAVLSNAPLIEHDIELLRAALRPKLLGAWNLHGVTLGRALEFFVMFGSLGGWVGLPGQSSYAAANAALDGLAEHRRAMGLPALNIGWCGWEGLGFARTAGGAASLERLAEQGMGALAADDALDLLDHLLAAEVCPVIAVMPPVTGTSAAPPDREAKLLALRELPPARRRAEIAELVIAEVAAVLREDPERIDRARPLRDLGLDSLMSVELGERLARATGLESSTTLIWQHPSVDALVTHFDAAIVPAAQPGREDDASDESLLDIVDALSDDDVEALLGAV
jgi:myxalamid-type polyketide synthase MxaE and MxaD